MGRWGDGEMGRHGDTETRRRGDTEIGIQKGQGDKRDIYTNPSPIPNSQSPIPNSQSPIPNSRTTNNKQQTTKDFILENQFLRVVVDPKTGDLSSVFDKIQQREVLSGSGNQLQAFQDKGQYWDAWNIDPNYEQYPLPPTKLQTIQWIEQGVLRSRVRVVRQLGKSQFCQDYILAAESPLLKIETTVDWQESHVLVKAAFPLNLKANYASYEIACGAIQRSTQPNKQGEQGEQGSRGSRRRDNNVERSAIANQPQTSFEQAKWEVSALRWADLGDETYGVSLLNDAKYGYDAQSSQLRLTLLRSPSWPDPEADRGIHHFTYALYPHSGSWQSAGTVRRGYELNLPLQLVMSPPLNSDSHRSLPPLGRLLDLSAENLILTTFKRSEDDSKQWILRCYESHGNSADFSLESDLGLSIAHPVDLLEAPIHLPKRSHNGQFFKIAPWKIASFAVVLGGN
ncbi:MAG: hypothetical protein F6J92_34370 [Symploca sp. SIO1A3]|nr:hypothetical protein [Symploca sp. SIO1A3]